MKVYSALRWLVFGAMLGACASSSPITKIYGGQQIVTRSVDPSAYEHVARAFIYMAHDHDTEAAAELQRALVYDRDSSELHAHLADLYVRLGRPQDAEREINLSMKLASTAVGYLAWEHLERRRGDFAKSLSLLRSAKATVDFEERADLAAEVYLALAEAEIGALDLAAAKATLTEFSTRVPMFEEARMRLMAVAWAMGEMQEARAVLQRILAENPNQVDALLALAWIETAEGQIPEATKAFREAFERSERSLEVAAAYARFLGSVGKNAEATQLVDDLGVDALTSETLSPRIELERAIQRLPRALDLVAQGNSALNLTQEEKDRLALTEAILRKENRDTDGALAALLSIGKDSAAYLESQLRAAEMLRELGRAEECKKRLETAFIKDPEENVEVTVGLALCEEKAGNPAAAVRRLEAFLRRTPFDQQAILALAAMEERRGNWQKALEISEAALAKKNTHAALLNFWGFVAADHRHALNLAKKRIQAAVALEPGAGGLLDSLGWVHLQLEEWSLARRFLEQASRLEPADPEINYHLGEFQRRKGDKEQAAAIFRRALTLSPTDSLRRQILDGLIQLEKAKAL